MVTLLLLANGLGKYEGNYGLYKTINGKPSWKKGFQDAIWYDKNSKKYVMGSLWQIADDFDEIPNDFGQSPVDQKVIGRRKKYFRDGLTLGPLTFWA